MKMWELIPKMDRPEAQVLLTLPNGEYEYVDGFLYQEFDSPAEAGSALTPAGPPHTRYRYLPRLPGTYAWHHRTPAGGILERGAFVAEPNPATEGVKAWRGVEVRECNSDYAAPSPLHPFTPSPLQSLAAFAAEGRGARFSLDTPSDAVLLPGGEPDLARCWLLDAALHAAAVRGVPVVLRLPAPAGPDPAQLYAGLHFLLWRYAAMPALAAWELAASGQIAEAASHFLRDHDPHHPVILAR